MADPIVIPAPGQTAAPKVQQPTAPKQDFFSDPIGSLGRFLFGGDPTQAAQNVVNKITVKPPELGLPPPQEKGALETIAGGLSQIVIKPIEWGATALSHMPIGWVPGGADDRFRSLGDWMKKNDPQAYAEWQIVNAASNADFLGGANDKADFTRKWSTLYIDKMKEMPDLGIFKNNPGLWASPSGSIGGALVDALMLAGLPGEAVQSYLGAQDVTQYRSDTGIQGFRGTRVEQIMERARRGLELNEIEATIVQNIQNGTWSEDHALAYLVRSGQGMNRDVLTQLVGSVATDPLNLAMLGSAGALKVTAQGARIAEQAGVATDIIKAGQALGNIPRGTSLSNLEHAAVVASDVSKNPLVWPVAKVARTIIDPFSVLGHDTPSKGVVDLTVALQGKAVERVYGSANYSSAFNRAAAEGITAELRSALGTAEANMARTWVVLQHALTQLRDEAGEKLFAVLPDSVVEGLMKTGERDAETRLVDWMSGVKKLFLTPEDDAQLAARIEASFGRVMDVAGMSADEKSLWHLATYGRTWQGYAEALAQVDRNAFAGKFDLNRLVIQNDNILDNYSAQAFLKDVRAAAGQALDTGEDVAGAQPRLGELYDLWKNAGDKWVDIADLGRPTRSAIKLKELNARLDELIKSGTLHTRLPEDALSDPALAPLVEWLGKNKGVDGKPLWNLGFAPDDFHRWGFRRTGEEGRLFLSRTPFVSHVMDATPAHIPVNDVLVNRLGQIIGPDLAGKIGKPVEAVEVAVRTMSDVVSGQRLLLNMEQRFIKGMATKYGLSPRVSQALFKEVRKAAEMERTTIQGVIPKNAWEAVQTVVKKHGIRGDIDRRVLMNEILDASGGDLRIMGLTSGLTQRARTKIEAATGAASVNFTGNLTVNAFRLMRYTLNPLFYVQRITDAVYFAIIKGVPAQGMGELVPGSELYRTKMILDKMGETNLSRYMALDMPEMQLMSTFQSTMFERLNGILGKARLEGMTRAGMRWQVNNMLSHAYDQMGNVVREALDEARNYARSRLTDPLLSDAERQLYQEAVDQVDIFGKLRARYGQGADHVLTDQEVGLRYIEEMFSDASGAKIGPDGLIQFREDVASGVYNADMTVGELRPLHQDYVAADLGYVDEFGNGDIKALREDVLHGDSSIPDLAEKLARHYNATPDFIERFTRAIQFDWNEFWGSARVALGLESAADREALQGIIAREAQLRGMTPVDYLSQVLPMTGGPNGPMDHVGRLLEVVRAGLTGDEKQQAQKLAGIWFRTLDPSAQRTLIRNYHGEMGNIIRQWEAEGTVESLAKAAEVRRLRGILEGQAADPLGPAAAARGIALDAVAYTDKYPPRTAVLRFGLEKPGGGTTSGRLHVTEPLGPGFLALPPKQQEALIAHIDSLREQFGMPIVHVDVFDKFHAPIEDGGWGFGSGVPAVFIGSSDTEFGVFLSPELFGPDNAAAWATRNAGEPPNALWDALGYEGLSLSSVQGPLGILYHEIAGHAVDRMIRRHGPGLGQLIDPKYQPFMDMLDFMESTGLPDYISRYAKRRWIEGSSQEWVAELAALAFTPTVDREALPLAIRNAVEDFRNTLKDLGVWKPPTIDDPRLVDPEVIDATIGHFADTTAERAVPTAGAHRPAVDPEHLAAPLRSAEVRLQNAQSAARGFMEQAQEELAKGRMRQYRAALRKSNEAQTDVSRLEADVRHYREQIDQWNALAGGANEAAYVRGTYRRLPLARRGLDLSGQDYERTFGKIGDRFESSFGLPYELRSVPLSEIAPKHGPKPNLLADYTAKVEAGSEMPPLVLGRDESGKAQYIVEDGNHRFATAQAAGLTEVKAYVPIFPQDVLPESYRASLATGPTGAGLAAGDAAVGATPTLDRSVVAKIGRAAQSGRRHPNPDIEGITRSFSQWAQAMKAEQFGQNVRGEIGDLISGLAANVPTDGAFHYNRSEALVQQLIAQNIKLAERDAFRLAEMSTQRTVASRTLNHPLFGMYPTSYMWGKVFPEIVKFLAKEPFGFESPIAGLTLARVQMSIAAQREFDPEFDYMMEKLGESETAFAIDYATPSLPWSDFRAALPLWFRNWMEKVSEGKDVDPWQLVQDALTTMDARRWYTTPRKAADEINDLIHGAIDQKQAPMPTPAAPTGQPQIPPPTGAMRDLQNLFSGQP